MPDPSEPVAPDMARTAVTDDGRRTAWAATLRIALDSMVTKDLRGIAGTSAAAGTCQCVWGFACAHNSTSGAHSSDGRGTPQPLPTS